jgi:uncharacterized protein (DUF4415 family)
MEDLKKSIEKLFKKDRKRSKDKKTVRPSVKSTFAEYVSSSTPKHEVRLRSHNPVIDHYKQQ